MNQVFQSFWLINSIAIQWNNNSVSTNNINTNRKYNSSWEYYCRELEIAIYSLTKSWILLNFILLNQLSMTWHVKDKKGYGLWLLLQLVNKDINIFNSFSPQKPKLESCFKYISLQFSFLWHEFNSKVVIFGGLVHQRLSLSPTHTIHFFNKGSNKKVK